MKVLFSFTLAILLNSTNLFSQKAEKDKINWLTWDEAVAATKETPKKIFIDIYTDWCGWCKRMDATTFANPEIVAYMNKHYYAIKMDAEMKDSIVFNDHVFVNPNPDARKSTHTLPASLLDNKLSYPSFVIMNEKVQRLNILKGYQKPEGLKPILQYFVEDGHLSIPWPEYLEEYKKNKEAAN